MKINNRRYIGCKTKLLDFIENSIDAYNFEQGSVFADIFAGTGVVGHQFAQKGFKTILNDILYSNVVVYKALLGEGDINLTKVESTINFFNEIDWFSIEPKLRFKKDYLKPFNDKYFR